MQPFEAPTLDLSAQTRDGEPRQLLRLQQRDQRYGAPLDNHVEILGKVPGPGSAVRGAIVLAGREGDADLPAMGADLYRGDLKGVGFAGSEHYGAPLELHDTRSVGACSRRQRPSFNRSDQDILAAR
jgi:hypothetical protein